MAWCEHCEDDHANIETCPFKVLAERPGGKGHKAPCPACGQQVGVSKGGTLRKHPRGSMFPCAGSYRPPEPETVEVEDPGAIEVKPGTYRARERMLDDEAAVPPGHVEVVMVAHIPYDGSNGRTPAEEAALLYEDPAHLYRTLDDTTNDRFRLVLRVPRTYPSDLRRSR